MCQDGSTSGRGYWLKLTALIAPDKFKGTLSASEVAVALGVGLSSLAHVTLMPLADGGDGSIEAVARAGFEILSLENSVPTHNAEPARMARRGDVFFIESAEFCGLSRVVGPLEPLNAHSLGVGLAVRTALDLGARTIVLGVGGTASTDGGVGFLTGLGAKFTTEAGETVPLGGGGLFIISAADFSDLDPRIAQTKIVLASDVDSPLLGPLGAAKLFAPQKGADPLQVEVLELGLGRLVKVMAKGSRLWAERTRVALETPGAGAGGGLGFAALFIGATRVSGAEYILDLLNIDEVLAGCNVVITGEGSLDHQSLAGKLPVVLAERARKKGIPVVGVAGTCRLSEDELLIAGFSKVYALDQFDANCVNDPELSRRVLARLGEIIGHGL